MVSPSDAVPRSIGTEALRRRQETRWARKDFVRVLPVRVVVTVSYGRRRMEAWTHLD
jgi:hypothetical protein